MGKTENIKTLQTYLKYGAITEKQAEIIVKLLNKELLNCKGHFMELIWPDKKEYRKVDSAFPIGISDQLRATGLPYHKQPKFAFSYINASFGELINIDQLFLIKFFEIFDK